MNVSMPRWISISLKIGTLLALFSACYWAWNIYYETTNAEKTAVELAISRTKKTAEYLEYFIEILKTETAALSQELKDKPLDKETIQKVLENKPTTITGLGVIQTTESGVSFNYYVEDNDKQRHVTLHEKDLAALRLPNNNATILSPIKDPATGKQVIIFAQAHPSKKAVLFATQSFDHINHILTTLHLGKNGYWILTDEHGTIIRHPQKELVAQKITLKKLAEKNKNNFNDNNHVSDYISDVTNHDAWLIAEKIPLLDWTLFGVFDKEQIPYDWTTLRHQWFWLLSSILLGTIFVLLLFIGLIRAWTLVSGISLALSSVLAIVWYIAYSFPHYDNRFIPIEDKINLYTFLDNYTKQPNKPPIEPHTDLSIEQLNYYLHYRYKSGKYVPTGIYVKELALASSESIEFVGYIWQRYFDGIHDRISRGFIFPQIAEEPTITEISRNKEHKTETIVWQVTAKLNQDLSYKLYPFDTKQLNIELRHKDFDKNIILVPDLDAYQTLNPLALPGISKDFYISGWNPLKSTFEFHIEQYRTNFGLYAYGPFGIYKTSNNTEYPLLTFGTTVKRNLLETLITDLLPLLIIALLLFICFITDIKQEVSGFVSSIAGILFAALVSHLTFRGKIPSTEIVYLETYYLVLYILMIVILILSISDMYKIKPSWFYYQHNKLAKLLYWPVLLSCLVIISMWYLH